MVKLQIKKQLKLIILQKDGDDEGCQPADDGYNDNSAPPGNYEKGMAVWNAVVQGGLAGGRGDDRTGQDRELVLGDFSPDTLGCEDGGCTQREVGGKINVNKINGGFTDPTGAGR